MIYRVIALVGTQRIVVSVELSEKTAIRFARVLQRQGAKCEIATSYTN